MNLPKRLSDRYAELQKNAAFNQIRDAVVAAMRSGAPPEAAHSPVTPQESTSPQPLSQQPTERQAGSSGFQNKVPSQEVSANVPHANLADSPSQVIKNLPAMTPVPKVTGIPEGTVKAAPELRNKGGEGFDATWRGTGPEPERGQMPAMAKQSSMAPGDRSEFVAQPKQVPPIDRNVRNMVGRDPEWNGSPPNRSFKPAPRRSTYRARGL